MALDTQDPIAELGTGLTTETRGTETWVSRGLHLRRLCVAGIS